MLRPFLIGLALCVSCALSGCTLFGSQLDTAAKGGGELVKFYCQNVTVPEIREELRTAVNKYAAPHSVAVTCAQGGVPLVVSPDTAAPVPTPPTN